ncbi:lysophospholipid acyltransferase family protein [Halalkalibacter hemicellulosilyticus]|uniref:1-acyl-sn-glycerol-3-phosphate acyltransferase n=1 Tax=Halalkalibacter hemicellulosilyticusJCM 9152 TaxID=1236971 RepID=W4QBF9_9BACI|nr:lysophospholipid acyltransferase family protein [Halalkalibacter hemicellulosilyticus]GAE28998.1 1-acyl-sn-glycerol-3-phosphate acyltransferase [Halalkalibacter hemicellulosilyticusJCM 9152]
MSIYQFGKRICLLFLSSSYKVEVIGRENIPEDGGVLLCCNHISNLDPPLLGSYLGRNVHYMAKKELFEKPILKWLLPKLHAFPIRRGMSDKQALRTAMTLLKNNEIVGLFPEGTRSKNGQLQKGLAGAGFFALRTNAAVIPSAIIGPYKFRGRLKLVYGEPIDFTELKEARGSAEEATSIIMAEIQNLINKHQ